MATLISAQRYRDEDTVEAKRAARDYVVAVSPEFEIDGETYCVVMDGHHSLAAAIADGVEPEYVEQTATDNDTICVLERGDIDDFLVMHRIDSDYYDVSTGHDIW